MKTVQVGLCGLASLSLIACTHSPSQSLFKEPAQAQKIITEVTSLGGISGDTAQGTLVNKTGLSPRLLNMITAGRARMSQQDFDLAYQKQETTFSTLPDAFTVKSARNTTPYMYISRNSNQIHDFNAVTGASTPLTTTLGGITSWGLAKDPISNEVYYTLNTGLNTLYKFNRETNTHTQIGNLNLPGTSYRLGFSPDGELYGADQDNLYLIDKTNAQKILINIANWPTGSGDLAFNANGNMFVIVGSNLYKIDLVNRTTTQTGTLTFPSATNGIGFDANNRMIVTTNDSGVYLINNHETNPTATLINTLTGTIHDLSSAPVNACPVLTSGRPDYPTLLFNDNFATMPANFGNLAGETNPDTTSQWKQWNGDYFPVAKGVTLWNPGVYNPASGGIDDPTNDVLGVRNFPGEYGPGGASHIPSDPRPNLLETAISRTVNLKYKAGDRLIAKVDAAPTFTHNDSDTTLFLCFDDPAQTIAVSNTIRGNKASGGQLFVDTAIPACATKVTVIALGYLGQNELSSFTFEKASLEFIPVNYYSQTSLLNESFDTARGDNTYGSNSPNLDEEFGAYDVYLTDKVPASGADKVVTAANPNASSNYGGIFKKVNLGAYQSGDTLSANIFTASTFTDRLSEASLMLEFYNSTNQKLATTNSSKVTATQYRWANIDRTAIPANSTYVKVVPIFKMGALESSSFIWNNLSLNLNSTTPPVPPTQLILNQPVNNTELALGAVTNLSTTPDKIVGGMTVEFIDGNNQVLSAGTQTLAGAFVGSWTPMTAGSFTIRSRAKAPNGDILITSSANTVTVKSVSVQLTAPSNNWSIKKGDSLSLQATATLPTGGGSVRFRVLDTADDSLVASLVGVLAAGKYSASWATSGSDKNKTFAVYADLLNNSATVQKTSGPATGTVTN